MVAVHEGDDAGRRQPPSGDGGTLTIDVDPSMIPLLAATFAEQANLLGTQLRRAFRLLRIGTPWLGDPVSAEAAKRFNEHLADSPLSLINVLMTLHTEYEAHYDALMSAAKHYKVTEETNAALMERGLLQ
ncbi:hypothetical protein [Allokutzneria oryzae]|uniref:PE domain-containing protein n=1 Tax=Allokutzneria oryzae TaxID=1378989 RepID=A0ABV5ZUW0_9PSEU